MGEKAKYWLGFNRIAGIGPKRLKRLLDYFGDVEAVWGAPVDQLKQSGLSQKPLDEFLETRKKLNLDEEYERLIQEGFNLVTWDDDLILSILFNTLCTRASSLASLTSSILWAAANITLPSSCLLQRASRRLNDVISGISSSSSATRLSCLVTYLWGGFLDTKRYLRPFTLAVDVFPVRLSVFIG